MNTAVTKPAAFKEMQTNIHVSMDDVVSAFVSQYENNLYDRKKELTHDIKTTEGMVDALEKNVLSKVTGDEFNHSDLPFGLKCEVGNGGVDWLKKQVAFKIEIKKNNADRYSSMISFVKTKPIAASFVKSYVKLTDELSVFREELSQVLVSLKSVARKERQVRGRIALRKLEDSGYADLMQDAELVKLVQLED